jgi:hypothetical protein
VPAGQVLFNSWIKKTTRKLHTLITAQLQAQHGTDFRRYYKLLDDGREYQAVVVNC